MSKPLGLKLERVRSNLLSYLHGEKEPFNLHIPAILSFWQTDVPEGKELSIYSQLFVEWKSKMVTETI